MISARAARTLAGQGYAVRRPAVVTMTPEEFAALAQSQPLRVSPQEFQILPDDLLPRVPEADFQAWVLWRADRYGWLAKHEYDSRRSQEGWPDVQLARAPRLIIAELKKVGGAATPWQKIWLSELSLVPGITVALWDPTDRREIEQLLGGAA